eukprot:1369800-Amorphochlora_amoeboformis.AAC.1
MEFVHVYEKYTGHYHQTCTGDVECKRWGERVNIVPGSEEVRDPGEVIRKYFQCWNERRMEDAIGLFDESLSYEDTL